jgi:hypothetical protein
MIKATTLVHKGAMGIAVHAVASFARSFNNSYQLQIHTDGSPDAGDRALLMAAANAHGMVAEIVTPADRKPVVEERLKGYPLTRELLGRGGYFTKLEMPVWIEKPYFYFDSDIVWLRPVSNLTPPGGGNAFSTESWSWYYGVCHDSRWIAEQTPRRVNSGFYHLAQEFPFQRMEDMLEKRMFDPTIPFNTDQEIMAYLFPKMVHYHIDDLKRSRVGSLYDLKSETCAALHFPGGMWEAHLDQIEALSAGPLLPEAEIRFSPSIPLTRFELFRMRAFMSLSKSRTLQKPLQIFRDLRKVSRIRKSGNQQ